MKNIKGMTLVEVVVSIALIGITALVFFRTAAFGYENTVKSNKYTVDSFKVQQDIEKKINEIRTQDVDLSQSNTLEVEIFRKKIKGHIVNFDIKSDTTSKHGEYTAFIPKIEISYEVPKIKSVSLTATTSSGNKTDKIHIVGKNNRLDKKISFKGSKVDGDQSNFLMNVYRWYISPVIDTYPANINDSDIKSFVVLKEWNEAREEKSYDFDDLSVIPNIKNNYDKFSFNEIQLDDDEIIDMFAGRYIVYSVTPYSDIGKIGEEKFSNAIYIEPVE